MVQICMKHASEFVCDEERRHRELALEMAKQRQRKFLSAFGEYRVVREFGGGDGSPASFAEFEDEKDFYAP